MHSHESRSFNERNGVHLSESGWWYNAGLEPEQTHGELVHALSLALIVFVIAAAVALGGALGVVTTRNIVYAAFSLLASLIGVAGLFLTAFAEFLALVQVLIYGGAIVIVILFALMLTRIQDFENLSGNRQWPIAAIVSVAVFALLAASVLYTTVKTVPERQAVPLENLGQTLFEQWAVPFEIASLVLLVALIGVVVMVGADGRRE
ncbi:MAG: NADH-quinone oxidoreductase subunit J [Dehalococcoidia bacterium]|nr:NADH-quinone oxidoreductase subunit J [Dehalococcoidia bacterium]